MPDVTIITAIYDRYDTLKPVMPQSNLDVDWVLVTDEKPEDDLGWRVVIEERPGMHPNRAAKIPKLFPWRYTDAPRSIWLDASFRVVHADLAVDLYTFGLAQFMHPWRDCLFDEAEESARIGDANGKYPPGVARAQAAAYREAGHPEHWGLWATGLIARWHDLDTTHALGAAWSREIDTWSFQDQISEPFVLRRIGARPYALPGSHLANRWVHYEGSTRH